METKHVKDNFDKKHYQIYTNSVKGLLNKSNVFFSEFGYGKELQRYIDKILNTFITELNNKYVVGIIDLLNLGEGKRINGKVIKKYYGSHLLLQSMFLTFELEYLLPEISLYNKYYKDKIKPKEYFNKDKTKFLVDGFFASTPAFEVMINYKIGIEHKRKLPQSEFKFRELFPALKSIIDSYNKCELRKAIIILENNQPGIIKRAGEVLNINYKKLCKIEYDTEQKNFKEGRKRSKQFSNDEIIEFQSRVLSKEIKSSFTTYLKNLNREY